MSLMFEKVQLPSSSTANSHGQLLSPGDIWSSPVGMPKKDLLEPSESI